jgi:allantoinase
MGAYDSIIRGGTVVTDTEPLKADLAIEGKVAAVEPAIEGYAGDEIDARRLYVFPGVIDAHAHFNEPSRCDIHAPSPVGLVCRDDLYLSVAVT